METPAAKLVISDRPGVLPTHRIREYFERALQDTEVLRPQPTQVQEGQQFAYENPETNIFWLGFALGMRCSERVHIAQLAAQLSQQTADTQDEWRSCRYCDNDENLVGCDNCGSEYCQFHWKQYGGCCLGVERVERVEQTAAASNTVNP